MFKLPDIRYPIDESGDVFNSCKFTSLTKEKVLSVPVSNERTHAREEILFINDNQHKYSNERNRHNKIACVYAHDAEREIFYFLGIVFSSFLQRS